MRREGETLLVGAPDGEPADFDAVISTTSPGCHAPACAGPEHADAAYAAQLRALRSMGAVVVDPGAQAAVAHRRHVLAEPARQQPGQIEERIPLSGAVSSTPTTCGPTHYGGDHLVYCGDYVPPDHQYFK